MNINIQNNNEFLKSEFIDQANVLGVKVYNEDAVLGLINVQKGLIEKAERAELNEEEKSQLDVCKAELQSIKKVVLVNDELEKENWFIRTSKGADIEKSKKASVGEIHEWNGKRYRKEATGKWVEVSEHGMSKKEHHKAWQDIGLNSSPNDFYSHHFQTTRKQHETESSKLSDKEHTDEEVGLGKKEEGKYKVGQKYRTGAPEGGEAIDFEIKDIKDGKYTIETTNKEGRKNTHTFDEKTIGELISESKPKSEKLSLSEENKQLLLSHQKDPQSKASMRHMLQNSEYNFSLVGDRLEVKNKEGKTSLLTDSLPKDLVEKLKGKSESKEEEGIWSQKNAAKQMSEAAKRNAPK